MEDHCYNRPSRKQKQVIPIQLQLSIDDDFLVLVTPYQASTDVSNQSSGSRGSDLDVSGMLDISDDDLAVSPNFGFSKDATHDTSVNASGSSQSGIQLKQATLTDNIGQILAQLST